MSLDRLSRMRSLEKLAFGGDLTAGGVGTYSPTVGISNPIPSVGDVLSAIGVAQANGIGTPAERSRAYERIVGTGIPNSAPAPGVLSLLGSGMLFRAITGAFTNNPFIKGVGAGLGVLARMNM